MFVFFFFKQKTAYEMRISDWSSDVCSSDLRQVARWLKGDAEPGIPGFFRLQGGGAQSGRQCRGGRRGLGRRRDQEAGRWADRRAVVSLGIADLRERGRAEAGAHRAANSEPGR